MRLLFGSVLAASLAVMVSGCQQDSNPSACDGSSVVVSGVNLSISGRGFFTLDAGSENLFSTKGDFCVDQSGNLINGLGYAVLGYPSVGGSSTTFDTGSPTRITFSLSNGSGSLQGVSVSATGVVEGVYSAGSNQVASKLTLANFISSQNLTTVNSVMCRGTTTSGSALYGQAGSGVYGSIQGGLLGTYVCEQGRFNLQASAGDYFRLNNGGTLHYDNAIILGVDKDGYYVDDFGYRVTGYMADSAGNIIASLTDLTTTTSAGQPSATTTVDIDANLNAAAAQPVNGTFNKTQSNSYTSLASLTIYDSLGNAHTLGFYFVKTGVANTWSLYTYLDDALMRIGGAAPQTVTFAGGSLTSSAVLNYDAANPLNGAANLSISFNMGGFTQLNSAFAVSSSTQNGYGSGVVTATHIATDGKITYDLSNGRSGVLQAQLVLASFTNPSGLSLSGDNETYLQSGSSGVPTVDVSGSSGLGMISAAAR